MADDFYELVDADTLRHYVAPKTFIKTEMQDRVDDLTAMLARTDRELLVALEGTTRYSDIADARTQWTAEKAELDVLIALFSEATSTRTFTVVTRRAAAARSR